MLLSSYHLVETGLVTLSIITYRSNKWWAFKQMRIMPPQLAKTNGCQFAKLLGTGSGNGFSLWPDFSTYALLIKWDSSWSAEQFFHHSKLFSEIKSHSYKIETHYLHVIAAHGTWHNENVFQEKAPYSGHQIAVVTRARIRLQRIPRFLQFVPRASRAIKNAKGLMYTKGIGEWPLIEQATFSIWENEEAMKNYAYQDVHRDIVMKVKKEKWYKEDLFARFNYLGSIVH